MILSIELTEVTVEERQEPARDFDEVFHHYTSGFFTAVALHNVRLTIESFFSHSTISYHSTLFAHKTYGRVIL